jgi:hypothetical protein
MAAKRASFVDQTAEILSRLDVLEEYRAMGVVFASERPRSSGMIECYARGRDEKKPSAAVNTKTGRYIDKGGGGESLSLFDFAAKYGGLVDWQAARKQFAEKAGVKLGSVRPPEDPATAIDFLDWTGGYENLATIWCRKYKPGVTLEALKLAGARVGSYPCFTDDKTGERRKGQYKVLALPAYGEKLLDADPCAWVLWNITGGKLPVYRGKGMPPDYVKMKSVGPTRGATMNFHALSRLIDDDTAAGVEWIIKTAGPSDMLALLSAQSEAERETHLVLTNASSETGDVLPHQVALFAARRAILVHDADEAGEAGLAKWIESLKNVAAELRLIKLPYQVQKKDGKDARDFLNGVPSDLGEQCSLTP